MHLVYHSSTMTLRGIHSFPVYAERSCTYKGRSPAGEKAVETVKDKNTGNFQPSLGRILDAIKEREREARGSKSGGKSARVE